MGASNYKKQRALEHKDGLNAREQAELAAAAKKKKTNTKYAIIAAVIVILIAAVLFMNSNLFVTTLPAVEVNDTAYSVADVNYYYSSSFMTFYNNYGSYITLFLDPNTPLEDQACTISSEEMTWADYFQQVAVDNLEQMTAYYDAAVAAGYTLTEDDMSNIATLKATYETQATQSGYDMDAYMVMNFGEGNNWKNVQKHIERELIVTSYLNDQYASYTFTNEELDAYYTENADSFDAVKFTYAYISGAANEEAGLDEETAMAEAADKAQAVMDGWNNGDLDAFKAAVMGVTATEAVDSSATKVSMVSQFGDAITADELEVGKAFVAESSTGWYVVYVTDITDCVYPTVDARHILIEVVDEDADGTYSDAEKQVAYDRIVEIRDEWLNSTADETAFKALATLYSEDEATNTEGGLYEQIYNGWMVEEFNDFCFGEREVGDYDIVYGETSTYAGYHLVYFVGENELYSRLLAKNAMATAEYEAFIEELVAPYTSEKAMMWRFVMP